MTLLKLLDRPGLERSSKEVVVRTLSILAVDNEVNQDHMRYTSAQRIQIACFIEAFHHMHLRSGSLIAVLP